MPASGSSAPARVLPFVAKRNAASGLSKSIPLSPDGEPPRSWWLVGVAVAWLLGFFLFFNSLALPNSQGKLTRAEIWQLVPVLYLNLIDPPEVDAPPGSPSLQHPDSGWHNVTQRFDIIAVAAVILFAAWAGGRLLLRGLRIDELLTRLERFVFACGLGLSALSLLTLGCGLLGHLNRITIAGVLIAAIAGEGICRWRTQRTIDSKKPLTHPVDDPEDTARLKWICLLAGVPFLLAIALGAMLPSFDFDVKEYHLQGPKEYFQRGRVTFLPHNVYTSFPFLTEMLSLLGMLLRDDWYRGALVGKVVLACFAPLTTLAVYAAGRRWFGPTAGCLAALIHLTTPWTYRISIIAYAEGGLTFYLFASLFAVMLGIRQSRDELESGAANGSRRLFLTAGLLAGSAMACKYPGVVQVVIPLGFVVLLFPRVMSCSDSASSAAAWKTGLRYVGVFTVGTVLAIGPWLAKNTVETGNPVYPLMWTVFGGDDWDTELNAKWRKGHSPDNHAPSDLAQKFLDVVVQSDWQSPLLFGLAPLAFLAYRSRRTTVWRVTAWLWSYVAFLFLAWWVLTHRIDRFWVPMIPVAALLAGAGAVWSESRV